MAHAPRGLGSSSQPVLGTFSTDQNNAILIVAITCATISLVATLITLRWFILMNRLFRHRLVLYLILSDTIKSLSYFVFPIVVFARGPVSSSSKWCQASGFFLSLSLEASDFAILLIALHAVLYVFRPPIRFGEGGLYPYRKWVPVLWLFYPVLAASLAFVNSGHGYVSSGTFCYLPQRPYWYRLALAWIPRYTILIVILGMYAAISIYVRIKFRSFKNLQRSESSSGIQSGRRQSLVDPLSPDIPSSPQMKAVSNVANQAGAHESNRASTTSVGFKTPAASPPQAQEPWETVAFITSSPLVGTAHKQEGIAAADFAATTGTSEDTLVLSQAMKNNSTVDERKGSETPTTHTDRSTSESQVDSTIYDPRDKIITDPLKRTRLAIRQQLRFLFIYPAVYLLMWAFPFANHCQLYSDRLAANPIFWLQVVTTCSLALQAAANCAIFSTREKPWRRINEDSKYSVLFWRQRGASLVKNLHSRQPSSSADERRTTTCTDATMVATDQNKPSRGPLWWEAEGRKRKDSVWMGTDRMNYVTSRDSEQSAPSTKSREDTIEEET